MRGRILVVEDSEEVREFLVLLLQGDGFAVSSCADADTAFVMAQRERPDLIVSDLMLGATSGLDLITRLRSDLAPPVPPIVVCSGFAGFEDEAMQRGADAFIPKPFEVDTIRKTVATTLARRRMAAHERDEALAQSRSLRSRAVEAAKVAVRRLERLDERALRARATSDFLPRYLGFGETFAALLDGDQVRVMSSSNEQHWRRGDAVDLPLVRDIMETTSALLVPDLATLGAVALRPNGEALRFFTGVPLMCGSVGVGALCFVDDAPHRIGADDYSLLETFGRRVTALLSGRQSEVAPMWQPSGLMSREGFYVVLGAELSRMDKQASSLGVLVFDGDPPREHVGERTAVAELEARRSCVVVTREDDERLHRALLACMAEIKQASGFDGGGLVMVEGGAASPFDAHSILRAAESLFDRSLRGGARTIEKIVIRRESQAIEGGGAQAH